MNHMPYQSFSASAKELLLLFIIIDTHLLVSSIWDQKISDVRVRVSLSICSSFEFLSMFLKIHWGFRANLASGVAREMFAQFFGWNLQINEQILILKEAAWGSSSSFHPSCYTLRCPIMCDLVCHCQNLFPSLILSLIFMSKTVKQLTPPPLNLLFLYIIINNIHNKGDPIFM